MVVVGLYVSIICLNENDVALNLNNIESVMYHMNVYNRNSERGNLILQPVGISLVLTTET